MHPHCLVAITSLLKTVSPYRNGSKAASHSTARTVAEFEVPNRPEMLHDIRERVAEFARTMPFSATEIEDIRLAVGEACANAVQHGHASGCCRIGVKMESKGDELTICVSDQGCGFDPVSAEASHDDELAENGRGIVLMRALMDCVRFCVLDPGTQVELTKRLRAHVFPR